MNMIMCNQPPVHLGEVPSLFYLVFVPIHPPVRPLLSACCVSPPARFVFRAVDDVGTRIHINKIPPLDGKTPPYRVHLCLTSELNIVYVSGDCDDCGGFLSRIKPLAPNLPYHQPDPLTTCTWAQDIDHGSR